MAETYVTLSSLKHYDEKIKGVIDEKQDKLVGTDGQVVSFDVDGNVISKTLEVIDTSEFAKTEDLDKKLDKETIDKQIDTLVDTNVLEPKRTITYTVTDSEGNIVDIIIHGGGFGHGVGMSQFGAGYMATKTAYMRQLPGRIVGMTMDKEGKRAYTLTQQAREQHIRRDKATSNICSNQALMCLSATIYLSLMGYQGILELEENAIEKAQLLAKKITEIDGFEILNKNYLNEFVVKFPSHINVEAFVKTMESKNVFAGIALEKEFPNFKNCLLVATTELNTVDEIYKYISVLKEI